MAYTLCEVVSEKQVPQSKVIRIPGVQVYPEFLDIPHTFLHEAEGKTYVAVAVVGRDKKAGLALIELPYEADSGAHRLWVPVDNLLDPEEVLS